MEEYPPLPGQVYNMDPNMEMPLTINSNKRLKLNKRINPETDPLLQNTNENIQEINKEKQEFFDNCENGKLDLVKRSLGINPNLIYAKGKNNRTCVLYSARGGKLEVFEYLIKKGADMNAIDIKGNNALHFAASIGRLNIVKFLVDKGFDVNKQNINNLTPLHWAVIGISIDVVSFLINKGANLNLKDADGRTPYNLALSYKRIPQLFKRIDTSKKESLLNDLTIIEKMLKEAMDKSPPEGGSRKSRSRRQRKRKSRTRKARR